MDKNSGHKAGDWDLVFSYTRAQAIEDGVLVDVSEEAREAGFSCPVAMTAEVWESIRNIPPQYKGIQDVDGRLWDVLFMAYMAAKRAAPGQTEIHYRLIMHEGRKKYKALKAVAGPGDEGELVVTIMEEGQD